MSESVYLQLESAQCARCMEQKGSELNNFKLEDETLQDPVQNTLFRRNQVILTRSTSEDSRSSGSINPFLDSQIWTFRAQTYYVWEHYTLNWPRILSIVPRRTYVSVRLGTRLLKADGL